MENCNNIALTEKHETKNKDELKKAMKLFNLDEEEEKDGRKEKDEQRGTN